MLAKILILLLTISTSFLVASSLSEQKQLDKHTDRLTSSVEPAKVHQFVSQLILLTVPCNAQRTLGAQAYCAFWSPAAQQNRHWP
jgi:hypothetical protein